MTVDEAWSIVGSCVDRPVYQQRAESDGARRPTVRPGRRLIPTGMAAIGPPGM